MAAPTGLAGQIGFKSETTWSTAVVVDQFLPFVSEDIKQEIDRLDSKGIRAGRRVVSVWRAGAKKVGGSIKVELQNKPTATLLRHMFGTIATTGAGPYTHTASPGDMTGKGLTIQVGRPDVSGTVQPFTYSGCKINDWELACKAGDIAELNFGVTGATETTGTALATASYAAGIAPFVFYDGTISVGGSAVTVVQECTMKAENVLASDRFRLGSATVKEQLENGIRPYTGKLTADFESLTQYNRYILANEFALVLNFTNGADSLVITTNARFDGDTPTVGGPDMLETPLSFTALSATTDAAAVTAVLINGESTST